jgi:uncharacterized protein YfaT (DUF1175 family)
MAFGHRGQDALNLAATMLPSASCSLSMPAQASRRRYGLPRAWLGALVLLFCIGAPMHASSAPVAVAPLTAGQSQVFRAWFVRVINEQLRQGPTPRWVHRDCAGLVRFAVNEAFKRHDARWLRANGIAAGQLPPELELHADQRALGNGWITVDGRSSDFVTALALIQANSVFVSRDINQARSGDLLFFDQGDEQHLMVWIGRYIAYHRGSSNAHDNGLRAVPVQDMLQWPDPRWQPSADNPNFIGVFKFDFLSR